MAAADNIVLVDATASARTITLPSPTNGRVLYIKDLKGQAASHNITIDPFASEKIDGASSLVISSAYGSVLLGSDGTNWQVLAEADIGNSGTVTSVAASVPAFLSIAGSPITTSGTLAISYSGTALPSANGGTGFTTYTTGDFLYASATNVLSKLAIGSTNNALVVTGGVPAWSSGTLTGSNSGDVTLAAIGSTPNANAASLSGQILNLQPASASFGGVVTTGTQTFAGSKTIGSNATDAIVIGASGASVNQTINGGLQLTTNTVSSNYNIV